MPQRIVVRSFQRSRNRLLVSPTLRAGGDGAALGTRGTWLGPHPPFCQLLLALVITLSGLSSAVLAESSDDALARGFTEHVRPFIQTYCQACHGADRREADLDLQAHTSLANVLSHHAAWERVRERLEAGEMPPEDALRHPTAAQARDVIDWLRAVRQDVLSRRAGDPGPVVARRLSNAEYNYSIRDLTSVDIRPAREFPVDPANSAGFDNSAESLAMSPALLQKYLRAARQVAEHLLLKPDGIAFAPHPVVTDTDRDKYCVKRIVEFYERQVTDYARYFLAAWRFQHRAALGQSDATLTDIAVADRISPKYLARVWSALTDSENHVGPWAQLRQMWRELPADLHQLPAVQSGCDQMRDFVVRVRRQLEPQFNDLYIEGSHKGSQPFVLWKNGQYAANRRRYNPRVFEADSSRDTKSRRSPPAEIQLPSESRQRADYETALGRFCDLFPDAFYVSERGRDYLGTPKEKQEKGRLLSAGFHSMMGYYRDDGPLYDLILSAGEQRELDQLWQELDFITAAPMRQFTGFVWFERTDSRYLRDPEFDFARAEDKDVTSEDKLKRLAEVYLAKARRNGGDETALLAIAQFFDTINRQIRWVEEARRLAEPSQLQTLLAFAARAYRRDVLPAERERLVAYYRELRQQDGLSHEEAVQDTLVSILMSPHFCYRMDLAGAGEDTRPLTSDELAARLSYFLWSSIPDQALHDRARAGDLQRPEVLVAEAKRMLQDDRMAGLATEFAGNWLDFRQFEQHNSVDRERFPEFTDELRQAMFEEPIRFFVDLVQHDRSVLEFLDADHSFVNSALARHYGLPPLDGGRGGWQRADGLAKYGRGGLLSMSVFLTQNSPGLRTSPVKRGYWVVRRLLGEHIPPPPPNVPELPNDERKLGDLTLPEILARHREHRSCAACHDRFDSIGLTLEGYGPVGERREHDLAGRSIDNRATLPGGTEGAGLDGLRRYLREQRQQEYLENLCRKLLSYALGRTLLITDEPLVDRMRAQLADDEYRFSSLVETIITSRQFLQKRG